MHYFCTVAEQGQVSKAARVLHMAQPPLSQRIRELEDELGTTLFTRKGRSLELTESGRLFYRRAREILRAVESSKAEVMRSAQLAGPDVRIGVSAMCRKLWLQRFPALQALFLERQMGVVLGDSYTLERLLLDEKLDLAFMLPPVQAEHFVVYPLHRSRMVAVAPPGLLAEAVERLSLGELSRHPLLLLRRSFGVGGYELLLRAFHAAGLTPRVACYSSDATLMLDVQARMATPSLAIIPDIEAVNLAPGYRILPLDVPLPDNQVSLVCPKNSLALPMVRDILTSWEDRPRE